MTDPAPAPVEQRHMKLAHAVWLTYSTQTQVGAARLIAESEAAALAQAEAGAQRKVCRWTPKGPGEWKTECGHGVIFPQNDVDARFPQDPNGERFPQPQHPTVGYGFCPFKGCGGRLIVEESK